jgi:hypothetical protein
MGHDELGASDVRDQPWSSGFFDWYSDIYGIGALESCRARQHRCSIAGG